MLRSVLLLLVVVSVIAACGGEPPVIPPSKPPASLDDQSDLDWRYRSQFKAHMRHMWIDSSRIVTAGRGDKRPNWEEIQAAAADIARRASLFNDFWREIDKRTEGILAALEDDDRLGAAEDFRLLGLACDGCHMTTWSPAFLHVTTKEISAWQQNRIRFGMEMETDHVPPPEIPMRVTMQKLLKLYNNAEIAVQDWDPKLLESEISQMRPIAGNALRLMGDVATNAETLASLALARKRDGMPEAYAAMTAACRACHAQSAGPDRPILNPMPWDGPVD